jgi:hypothetical protein
MIDIVVFLTVAAFFSLALFLFARDYHKLRTLRRMLEEKNWCDMTPPQTKNAEGLSSRIKETKFSLRNNKTILFMSVCYATVVIFMHLLN